MNKKDTYKIIEVLREVFDYVILIDPISLKIVNVNNLGDMSIVNSDNYNSIINEYKINQDKINQSIKDKQKYEKFYVINNKLYFIFVKELVVECKRYIFVVASSVSEELVIDYYNIISSNKEIDDIHKKIYIDVLTGLYSRRFFEENKLFLDNSQAIAIIDIDDFKRINDTYGHLFGDIVLRDVGKKLNESINDQDVVIRYGGDEFFIAFSDVNSNELFDKLEKIRQNVKKIKYYEKPDLQITVSIGGQMSKCNNSIPFDQADKKLYIAKQRKDAIEI